jgi:hypothetical protein
VHASIKEFQMSFNIQNDPNPGRLIESLRNLGYGNYEAIADIIDNSIDAEASAIHIKVGLNKGEIYIHIADNGMGMDLHTLDQAMRLGSLTERNTQSDLGKFGMGLVTASLSIARSCTVITRQDGIIHSSAWDVDEIKNQNAFVKRLDTANLAEEQLLNEYIGDASSGTLVILEKCDQLTNTNTSIFSKILGTHIGRVHRHFIKANRRFTINGENVCAIDPLELDNKNTQLDVDVEIPIRIKRSSGESTEMVRVRIALVPPKDASEHDLAVSLRHQGFYLMRNQREILAAHTLDCFTKHNDFNQMRGEIFFPGTMDDVIGIEFTKRQVNFQQSIEDQLLAVLKPNCSRIKRHFANKGRKALSEQDPTLHDQALRAIAEKDKLLLKPRAKVEKRDRKDDDSKVVTPPLEKGSSKTKTEFKKSEELERKLNCKIVEEKMGPNGQIYECDLQGTTIVIRYNIEHPFYQRFILENSNEGRMISAADFLIYSMASAELRMQAEDGDKYEVVKTFTGELSANLRTLLN